MALVLLNVDQLAGTLQVPASDPRLAGVAQGAEDLVLAYVELDAADIDEDDPPPLMVTAAEHVAAYLWKLPTAPGGIAGITDLGDVRLPSDALRYVRALLAPYRTTHGVV